MKTLLPLFASAIALALAQLGSATILAYDDADSAAYADGWQDLDNGGFGFGLWHKFGSGTLSVGDSNTNGSGAGPGISTAAGALGINNDQVTRDLAFSAPAQYTLSFEFDTGSVPSGGFQRVWARTVVPNFINIYAYGGWSTYQLLITSENVLIDTGISINDGGMKYSITVNGDGTYTGLLHAKNASAGADFTWSRALTSPIQGIGATSFQAGSGAANTLYLNSLSATAVPEPATMLALAAGIAAIARKRGRRVG